MFEGYARQWLQVLIVIIVSLGMFVAWDIIAGINGISSEFSYNYQPIESFVIEPNVEKALTEDEGYSQFIVNRTATTPESN